MNDNKNDNKNCADSDDSHIWLKWGGLVKYYEGRKVLKCAV